MGNILNTMISLTASAVNRSNMRRTLRNVDRINESTRNVTSIGAVGVDSLIPSYFQMGNVCISGGGAKERDALVVQNCIQAASLGMPTVVLHENNTSLENELTRACASLNYFRIINASNPYYEPVLRLSDEKLAMLIVDSSLPGHKIESGGELYIRALATILRKRGIVPYIRMLASCPHSSIQSIIANEEKAGRISQDEATAIRKDIADGSSARGAVERFFAEIVAEGHILAGKSNLSRSTSIADCIRTGGVLCIDVSSMGKKALLSLIESELERCVNLGTPCRLVIDAVSIRSEERLKELLKTSSNIVAWTVSTPDISGMMGGTKEEIASWLALCHKAVIFSHGVQTSEVISASLGEYDHINVTQTNAGTNAMGGFGYHFGSNVNIGRNHTRERVIKPEHIEKQKSGNFILLDNNKALIFTGELI